MLSRASAFWLLLVPVFSLSVSAQESVQDSQQDAFQEASTPHGDYPHTGTSADTSALPLEELQMFADVFNQIRQGYVESVPDSELFELAVQGMLSGLDPIPSLKEKPTTHYRRQPRASSAVSVSRLGRTAAMSPSLPPSTAHPPGCWTRGGDVILKSMGSPSETCRLTNPLI